MSRPTDQHETSVNLTIHGCIQKIWLVGETETFLNVGWAKEQACTAGTQQARVAWGHSPPGDF